MDWQASHKSEFQRIGNAFGSTGVEREHIWPSGEDVFSVLGDADNAFRATSVERKRNYTSSRRSDQNSTVISFDERRAGAKPWWGLIQLPFGTVSLLSENVIRKQLKVSNVRFARPAPHETIVPNAIRKRYKNRGGKRPRDSLAANQQNTVFKNDPPHAQTLKVGFRDSSTSFDFFKEAKELCESCAVQHCASARTPGP